MATVKTDPVPGVNYDDLVEAMRSRVQNTTASPTEAAWAVVRELKPKQKALIDLYRQASDASKQEARHARMEMRTKVAVLAELTGRYENRFS